MNNDLIKFFDDNAHLFSKMSIEINELRQYIQDKFKINHIEAAYALIILQQLKINELESKLK